MVDILSRRTIIISNIIIIVVFCSVKSPPSDAGTKRDARPHSDARRDRRSGREAYRLGGQPARSGRGLSEKLL